MRPIAAFLLIVAIAPPATAAERARGVIEGTVVNETTGEPQIGVEITLTTTNGEGTDPRRDVVTTGTRGAYRFSDLVTGPDRVYTLDARHDGGMFAGDAISLPDDVRRPVIETTIRVWDTTDDPAAVLIERNDLFVVPDGNDASVIESVTIVNPTSLAYIGRGAEMTGSPSGRSASFGFALPEAAFEQDVQILESDINMPAGLRTDFGFATTVAIPPGTTRTTFAYRVPGSGGTFELGRSALYPILDLWVHAAPPLDLDSNRLRPGGRVEIEGTDYRIWKLQGSLDAGDPIQLALTARGDAGSAFLVAAGAAASLLVLGLAGGWLRNRRAGGRVGDSAAAGSDRAEVVAAVARLDLRYQNGELTESEWSEQRNELKEKLVRSGGGGANH